MQSTAGATAGRPRGRSAGGGHSITGDLEEAHSGQAAPTSSRFQESNTEKNGGGEERRAKHRPRAAAVEPRPGAERGGVVARAQHARDEGS